MSSFVLGLIIGILGTGLITGTYIAYLLGQQKAKRVEKDEGISEDKTNKGVYQKPAQKKNIPTEFPGISHNSGKVNHTSFSIKSSTKKKVKNKADQNHDSE